MGPVGVGLALCAVLLLTGSWAMGLGPAAVLATITVVAGGPFVVARIARRRFGGYTGDILGASSVVVETAALIVLASAVR
jgi:adenosylcobinamide-GDP ribazoletransferase